VELGIVDINGDFPIQGKLTGQQHCRNNA